MKSPSFPPIGRFAIQGAVFGLSAAVMVVIVSIVYAAASWGSLPSVSSGGGLTATAWNDLVAHVNQSVKQASPVITVSGSNVGIGTTSPGEKLSIYDGNLKITQTAYPAEVHIGTTGGFGSLKLKDSVASQTVQISSQGNSWLNGGNVGIGTTSPSDTLTVNGGVTAARFTASTAWTAVPGNGTWSTTGGVFSCRRMGSFLQLKGYISLISGNTSGWPVAAIPSLPSNCWPSTDIYYIPWSCWSTASTTSLCLVHISPTGALTVYNNNAFYIVSFPGTYPAD